MGIFEEMAKRSPKIEDMKIQVMPGDDINKAVWRFEREIIEAPLESSANWDTMARRLGVFEPFQTADSANPLQSYTESNPQSWVYSPDIASLTILHREGAIIRYEHQYKQTGGSDWLTYREGQIDTGIRGNLELDSDYIKSNIERVDEYTVRVTTLEAYDPSVQARILFSVDRILQPRRRFNIPTGEAEYDTAILTVSDLDWRS